MHKSQAVSTPEYVLGGVVLGEALSNLIEHGAYDVLSAPISEHDDLGNRGPRWLRVVVLPLGKETQAYILRSFDNGLELRQLHLGEEPASHEEAIRLIRSPATKMISNIIADVASDGTLRPRFPEVTTAQVIATIERSELVLPPDRTIGRTLVRYSPSVGHLLASAMRTCICALV